MRLIYRIAIINIFIALLIAWLFHMGIGFTLHDLLAVTGAVFVVTGVFNLLVSLVLFLAKKTDWAKGFLLSGGILLLTGSAACSSLMVFDK